MTSFGAIIKELKKLTVFTIVLSHNDEKNILIKEHDITDFAVIIGPNITSINITESQFWIPLDFNSTTFFELIDNFPNTISQIIFDSNTVASINWSKNQLAVIYNCLKENGKILFDVGMQTKNMRIFGSSNGDKDQITTFFTELNANNKEFFDVLELDLDALYDNFTINVSLKSEIKDHYISLSPPSIGYILENNEIYPIKYQWNGMNIRNSIIEHNLLLLRECGFKHAEYCPPRYIPLAISESSKHIPSLISEQPKIFVMKTSSESNLKIEEINASFKEYKNDLKKAITFSNFSDNIASILKYPYIDSYRKIISIIDAKSVVEYLDTIQQYITHFNIIIPAIKNRYSQTTNISSITELSSFNQRNLSMAIGIGENKIDIKRCAEYTFMVNTVLFSPRQLLTPERSVTTPIIVPLNFNLSPFFQFLNEFKGSFSRIILDNYVISLTKWHLIHLKSIYDALQVGGELIFPISNKSNRVKISSYENLIKESSWLRKEYSDPNVVFIPDRNDEKEFDKNHTFNLKILDDQKDLYITNYITLEIGDEKAFMGNFGRTRNEKLPISKQIRYLVDGKEISTYVDDHNNNILRSAGFNRIEKYLNEVYPLKMKTYSGSQKLRDEIIPFYRMVKE